MVFDVMEWGDLEWGGMDWNWKEWGGGDGDLYGSEDGIGDRGGSRV